MKKEEFVSRILDGVAPKPKKASKATSDASFSADDVFGNDDTTAPSVPPPADTRFAQLLLEEVFAHGEAQPPRRLQRHLERRRLGVRAAAAVERQIHRRLGNRPALVAAERE